MAISEESYNKLLVECIGLLDVSRRDKKSITLRSWRIGEKIRQFFIKNKVKKFEEQRVIKRLSRDLGSYQIHRFLIFFDEWSSIPSKKKLLPWTVYVKLTRLPKKERKKIEDYYENGKFKNRRDLNEYLAHKRGDTRPVWG